MKRWTALLGSLVVAILLFLLMMQRSASAFQQFDTSYYGTGGGPDQRLNIPRVTLLEDYMPVDDSGFTSVVLTDCTTSTSEANGSRKTLQDAINAAADGTVITLPNCTMTWEDGDGDYAETFISIPATKDNLVIQGNSGGLSKIVVTSVNPDRPPDSSGYRHALFRVGSDNAVLKTTEWLWEVDRGGAGACAVQGSKRLCTTTAIGTTAATEVYGTDIVAIEVDALAAPSASNIRHMYEVVCAVWNDSTVHPTAHASCSGLAANTIIVDEVLQLDYSGASYYNDGNGDFGNPKVQLVERRGGGTLTDILPEGLVLKDFDFEHTLRFTQQGQYAAFEFHTCFECVLENTTTTRGWGPTYVHATDTTHRLLIHKNDWRAPQYKGECTINVTGFSGGASGRLQGTKNAGCDAGNACGLDPYIYFPPNFDEPSLRDSVKYCSCTGGSCSNAAYDVELYDVEDGTRVNVTGFATPAGPDDDWAMQLNQYNIAVIYVTKQASEVQFVNNYVENARVGVICEKGGSGTTVAYNKFVEDPGNPSSRGFLFLHGGSCAYLLAEGNDGDVGFVTRASAPQGVGVGPIVTLFRNRIEHHTITSPKASGCGDFPQSVCNVETPNQSGNASENGWWVMNTLAGYNDSQPVIADCETNPGTSGCGAPYYEYEFRLDANLWYGEDTRNFIETDGAGGGNNPTFFAPDLLAFTYPMTTLNATIAARALPTSIYRDAAGTAPDWWCQESGTFPNIGADSDVWNGTTFTSKSRLPAEIRAAGDTCTLGAALPVTPVLGGGIAIGGGTNIN